MNAIKRILGVVWLALAVFAGYYLLVTQAIPKFESGKQEDMIPAIIYTFVLAPIVVGGLGYFGFYSVTGEYGDDK